jgi:hypothetical protein
MTIRERLARWLLGKQFFNRDASLEIDRLTVENEALRAQAVRLERHVRAARRFQ